MQLRMTKYSEKENFFYFSLLASFVRNAWAKCIVLFSLGYKLASKNIHYSYQSFPFLDNCFLALSRPPHSPVRVSSYKSQPNDFSPLKFPYLILYPVITLLIAFIHLFIMALSSLHIQHSALQLALKDFLLLYNNQLSNLRIFFYYRYAINVFL